MCVCVGGGYVFKRPKTKAMHSKLRDMMKVNKQYMKKKKRKQQKHTWYARLPPVATIGIQSVVRMDETAFLSNDKLHNNLFAIKKIIVNQKSKCNLLVN